MIDFEKDFWVDFCKIHKKLKRYYILSEECSKDFSVTLQPIKEQRDALEHIVRSYSALSSDDEAPFSTDYIKGNLSKAKGHIYRAFYDTADILTIILRERISDYLSGFSYKDILKVWENYPVERKFLIDANFQIAEARIDKDIIESKAQQEQLFDKYDSIIEHLFRIYTKVLNEVYPALSE